MSIQPNDQIVPSNDQIVPSNDQVLDPSQSIDAYNEIPEHHLSYLSEQQDDWYVPIPESSSLDRTSYWKNQKQIKRKSKTLEDIIQSLSTSLSPLKNQLIQNVVQNHPKSIEPLLKQNENDVMFENLVSDALIRYLNAWIKKKKFPKFHECLNDIFGDQLSNDDLLEWLSMKLEIRPSKFKKYVLKWRENQSEETRGRQE